MQHRRRTMLGLLIAVALVGLVMAPAAARQATVTLKSGRTVTGEIVSETEDRITLEISGIRAPFNRDQIESIEMQPSIEEQYRERKAATDPDDANARYQIASWLAQRGALELAKQELDQMAERFPDDRRVTMLRQSVVNRMRPAQPAPATPEPAQPDDDDDDAEQDGEESKLPTNMLTEEQVNLLKVWEIDPRRQPRVDVPNDVIDELYVRYSDRPEVPRGQDERLAFRGAPDYRQLALLFELRAREFYPRVKVFDDPRPIEAFRSTVHRNYVLAYCGSRQCHGGENAGEFFLFNKPPFNADRNVYTNFFILRDYQNNGQYMLDVEDPFDSLLIQYGLLREDAKYPHPEVRGMRPFFRNTDTRQIEQIARWIYELGPTQEPPYLAGETRIDYTPPSVEKAPEASDAATAAEAEQPATQP